MNEAQRLAEALALLQQKLDARIETLVSVGKFLGIDEAEERARPGFDEDAPASLMLIEAIKRYATRSALSTQGEEPEPAPEAKAAPKINEKDINRWQALIQERPEGPWEMGNGGSFDRTVIKPISDDMLAELANWLRLGYTPWNGRSIPLNAGDRQFMYMLYFSVQGLIARVRAAEKALATPFTPRGPGEASVFEHDKAFLRKQMDQFHNDMGDTPDWGDEMYFDLAREYALRMLRKYGK